MSMPVTVARSVRFVVADALGMSRASAASHTRSAGSYRTRHGAAARRRVLVAEHEQLGILRQVAAGYQDSEAQYPAN